MVDGGFVDTGDQIVEHINRHYGRPDHIDNVVVSHADQDHAGGLIKVFENFWVGNLWINRPWLFVKDTIQHFHGNYSHAGLEAEIKSRHQYLVDLEKFAINRGATIHHAFQGADIGPFTVLSPSPERYVELIPDFGRTPTSYADNALTTASYMTEAKKALKRYSEMWDIETLEHRPEATTASNESSLVQVGYIDKELILFTSDAGPSSLLAARDYFEVRWPHMINDRMALVQVPHHGSRRNSTPAVLNRWLGPRQLYGSAAVGAAVCCVGASQQKYPRRRVSNAFLRRGYPVHNTRDGAVTYFKGMPNRGWGNSNAMDFEWEFEE